MNRYEIDRPIGVRQVRRIGFLRAALSLSGAEQDSDGDASASRSAAGSVRMAPAHAKHCRPNAPSSDLCRSLLLRASPRGSQTNGFEWSQGQIARDADVKVDGSPKDRLPAYITWDRYLANQERLLQNRYQPGSVGAPRAGKALLTGLLVCGACGRRMHASYRSKSTAYYMCVSKRFGSCDCPGLASGSH